MRLAVAGSTACVPIGCAALGSWDLAGRPGLLLPVKQYYEVRAFEQGGRCRAPELKGVTESEIINEQPGSLEVRVRYFYRDFANDQPGQCKGFSERVFTVATQDDQYEVQMMTGDQRR